MAESAEERTEAPTPRRRREAREKGQVARSNDLGGAVVLLAALIALYYLGQPIMFRLLEVMRYCLGDPNPGLLRAEAMPGLTLNAIVALGYVVLPLLLVMVLAAILAQVAQIGWSPTSKPLMPSLMRLNPVAGFSRFFSARHLVQLLFSIVKTVIVAWMAWYTLRDRYPLVISSAALHHWGVVAMLAELMFTLAMRLAILLLILGIVDYAYQRYRHEKDLKMTKQEVKDEMKSMEGDPKIKQKRRTLQIQLAIQRMRAAVPRADVVVTNPTEFAVALKYDDKIMAAPKVVAKGEGYMALQIRRIAIEHGVPIIERPPLARALFRAVEVGQEIPSQFYQAVAEILAYVYELAGKGSRRSRPAASTASA